MFGVFEELENVFKFHIEILLGIYLDHIWRFFPYLIIFSVTIKNS